ncbi:MAG TPA: phospholipid carrier-dependent glycosyltransferase [Vicinamibacterales bacterium]|nr:phospholipid carrier-dependent glycosyltransferase [Vicinamibacterales bacterium]
MSATREIRRQAAIVLIVGGLAHFVALSHPREVVFDEATFGNYVAAYCCTGQHTFDVHPPHGKLLIALGAKLGGFDGSFTFDHIGQPYGDQPVVALRFMPALAGTLIPLVFFFFLRELRASPPIAFLGGLLVALDNALLVDTRIIVFDGILVAATFGALACFLSAQRTTGIGWRIVLAGLLAGLALGTKTTGLAALALMGICLAFGLGVVRATIGARVKQAVALGLSAALVYAAGWVVHWMVLPNPGPGDAFYETTGHMVPDLLTAHRTMIEQNVALSATHPDASRPWTWPFMKVAPYLWQGTNAAIYMVGNPIVWWGTALIFLAVLVQLALLRPLGARPPPPVNSNPRLWVPLAGYAIAFVPLLPVTRVLFLYHYWTPLLFSLAFVLLWLDRSGWARPGGFKQQRVSYIAVITLAVIGFVLVSPLTYGFSVGGYDEWLVGIVRSWR